MSALRIVLGVLAAAGLLSWGSGCSEAPHRDESEAVSRFAPDGDAFRFEPAGAGRRGIAKDELLIIESDRAPAAATTAPDLPRGGELRAKLTGGSVAPFPLKHTDVKARIALHLGSVRVRQQYHNPYSEKVEAVYVFPLPEDAAVRDFVLAIGERRIRGIIREREEARRIYFEARRQGHVASLLTEARPNIFEQSVANIEPGKQVDVDITYFQTLPHRDGAYELHFPMVVGPRFNPPGFHAGIGAVPANAVANPPGQPTTVAYLRPTEISSHDIALEVEIDAGLPIAKLECSTHQLEVERPSLSTARVRLAAGDRIPNKDLVLRYAVDGAEPRASLATWVGEQGGYFALVFHPPAELPDAPAPPRDMIFVLDCSGSMSGQPLEKCKTAVNRCLARLRPVDSFQVVRFSSQASSFGPSMVPATPENVAAAIRHVEGLSTDGGTMMLAGLTAALSFPHDHERLRIVVFLTDGYIGNDREVLAEVARRVGEARIFSFGAGSSVNRFLLEGMARLGRGAAAYLLPGADDTQAADAFIARLEKPALRNIRVDWSALGATDIEPTRVPDLYPGRPVVVTGRFQPSGSPAAVRIDGDAAGIAFTTTIPLDLASPGLRHEAVAALWARSRIARLSDELLVAGDPTGLTAAIRQTALEHGLVSTFTAFVAVDSTSRRAGSEGTTLHVPVPMPLGVKYETTVGE